MPLVAEISCLTLTGCDRSCCKLVKGASPPASLKGVYQLHQQQSWKWNQPSDVYRERQEQPGTKISGQAPSSPLHYLQMSTEPRSRGCVNTGKEKTGGGGGRRAGSGTHSSLIDSGWLIWPTDRCPNKLLLKRNYGENVVVCMVVFLWILFTPLNKQQKKNITSTLANWYKMKFLALARKTWIDLPLEMLQAFLFLRQQHAPQHMPRYRPLVWCYKRLYCVNSQHNLNQSLPANKSSSPQEFR